MRFFANTYGLPIIVDKTLEVDFIPIHYVQMAKDSPMKTMMPCLKGDMPEAYLVSEKFYKTLNEKLTKEGV